MFAALGRLTSRRPWWFIGAWVVIAIVVVSTAPGLKATTDQSDFLPQHYESIKASNLIKDAFPQQKDAGATIVFDRTDGKTLSDADLSAAQKIVDGLHLGDDFDASIPSEVTPSPTNQVAIANLAVSDKGQADQKLTQIKTLRADLKTATAGTGLQALTTGNLPQSYDQSTSGNNAEKIVGIATFLLIVILLSIIFRSVLIALMPIVLVGIVALIANGLIGFANKIFDLKTDSSISVILIVVLFGIGTDYILFFLFRHRERMRVSQLPDKPKDKAGVAAYKSEYKTKHKAAVEFAVEHAGEAIASAGGAVFVAFMTLILSSLGIFRSIGPALAIAVAVTLIAAVTLVPAAVTVVGRGLYWPSKNWRKEPKGSAFAWIGGQVGKHPGRTAITAGAVLVILTLFAFLFSGFKPTFDLGQLPASAESSKATAKLEAGGFTAGATQPVPVVLHSDQTLTSDQISSFVSKLSSIPGVASVSPEATSSADGKTALAIVTLQDDPSSDAALQHVKNDLRPDAHAAAPPGTVAYVGGITSVFVDFQAAMNRDYSIVFPVAALIIMLILALVLRSLVAPWYLMASVGLGFGATLGATVIVFQHIKGDHGLIFLLPIYIYLFVVALGTDYNILMITRLREEARRGKTPREAAAIAVQHAGPTIGAAGLILAGTFASLMLAGQSLLETMGFAISFGIAIAAFVMAMFLTPSLTALIGHRAWWPGHGDEGASETEEELVAH